MILDTNALSAFVDGDSAVGDILRTQARAVIPVIVLGEFRFNRFVTAVDESPPLGISTVSFLRSCNAPDFGDVELGVLRSLAATFSKLHPSPYRHTKPGQIGKVLSSPS